MLNWLSPLATLRGAQELSGGRVPAEILKLARSLGATLYLHDLTRGPGFSAWVAGRGHLIVLDRTFVSKLTPEHIRFVMAHELGHVALGHLKVRWLLVTSGAILLPAARRVLKHHEEEADSFAERLTGFRREFFDRPTGGANVQCRGSQAPTVR